jgi:hypothetical protein
MPQPIAYNTGSQTSGSIKLFGIEYAVSSSIVSGSNNQRWFSSVNPGNGVTFVTSNVTQSFGTYATSVPLFFTASNYTAAAITGAINGLPDRYNQPIFTTTASAYAWVQNSGKYFMMNYEYSQITTNGLVFLVDAGLLGSYPTTQSIWYNISGFNNSGSLINSPTFNSAGAIVFDGIDDYAAVGTLPNVSTFCTVNALVRRNPSVATTNGALFGFGTTAGNTQDIYYWANYPGASYQFGFNTWNGDSWGFNNSTASGEVMDGRWHYLTAVFNRNNITGSKIYVDGISKALSQVFGTTVNRSVSSNFGISYNGWNTGDQLFNGDISSVEVYGRELSQSEVLQNYYGGPIVTDGLILALDAGNLVSYPKSGTTAYSLTGSVVSSLINGTSFNQAYQGMWVFDGTDDLITGSVGTLNAPFTIEYWGRFDALTRSPYEYFGSIGNATLGQMMSFSKIGTQDPNVAYHGFLYIYDGGANAIKTDIDLKTLDWIHGVVVATADSPYAKVYKNGIEGNLIDSVSGPINTSGIFRVAGWSGGTWDLIGNIGIHRIYNRALSTEEIQQNFNAQKSRFGL